MEAQQLKRQLGQVQFVLKYTKDILQQKENEQLDRYKKNVELLKNYNEEKSILQTNLQNYVKKVKGIEQKVQHVFAIASKELDNSRQGKRDYTYFSSSQEKGL